MPVSSMISQGIELLFLGMGTVFVFLAILVAVVGGMTRLSVWLESRYPAPAAASAPAPANPGERIAAIAAAVHLHRIRNA